MDGSPSDTALLAAVGQRDLDAMRELYDRHAAWLAVRLSRRCNDRDLVADAVQDTFMAVWQKPQGLLGSPPVLILDEPTAGVDPEQRAVLRTVLAELARTSTVVLSTHQTEDVAALCDRVVVLNDGRVRYDGQVTELVSRAAGRVWLADAPDPAASVSWRTGTGRYRNVAEGARTGVEHVEPSLEDAYLLLRGSTTAAEQVRS